VREQIRRILGLIASGRLNPDDALPLLAALHPKLGQVQQTTFERLFGLLDTPDFGPDRVADLLVVMTDPPGQRASGQGQSQSQWGGGQQSQSQSQQGQSQHSAPQPPRPPQPGVNFKVGGVSYPFEDLGDAISARVEEALGGLLGKGNRPARPGTILKIETEDAHGASFSANLPLSLAAHAERLIPPHALASLERSGLTVEALKLLLQAGPPPGKLLSAEDEHGNSVDLSIQ